MCQSDLSQRYEQLLAYCREKHSLLVAYSGGVDSTLVAYAARQALSDAAQAVFFRTSLNTEAELAQARATADQLDLILHVLKLDPLSVEEVAMNRRERCYACKLALYRKGQELAKAAGLIHLADGNNADDRAAANRPGSRAAAELGIVQPLAALNFTKAEVRALARELGLPNHDLPSRPCLATRFPYDTALDAGRLAQVAAAERFLQGLGLVSFRLRVHGELARLEADPAEWALIMEHREPLLHGLQDCGFPLVTLDLRGFASGSFDKE